MDHGPSDSSGTNDGVENEEPRKPGSEESVELPEPSSMQSLGNAVMEMTLEHLKLCADEGHLPKIYDTLMHSFQSTILNTHKSKFIQFFVFYLCSLAPKTCSANFVSMLCDIFLNKSRPRNTRMTAAAYLSSYLSRAKYLLLSVVSAALGRLVDWCLQYLYNHNKERKHVNPGVHGVFYSTCQAVMYILCFRMKSLIDDPKQRLLLEKLPLKKIIEHKLNPLKICLPTVVEEFLRQVKAVHLFEVLGFTSSKNIIETEESKAFRGVERVGMFFQFDPYLLKCSDRFIRPNFTFWSMVQTPVKDDDF